MNKIFFFFFKKERYYNSIIWILQVYTMNLDMSQTVRYFLAGLSLNVFCRITFNKYIHMNQLGRNVRKRVMLW